MHITLLRYTKRNIPIDNIPFIKISRTEFFGKEQCLLCVNISNVIIVEQYLSYNNVCCSTTDRVSKKT